MRCCKVLSERRGRVRFDMIHPPNCFDGDRQADAGYARTDPDQEFGRDAPIIVLRSAALSAQIAGWQVQEPPAQKGQFIMRLAGNFVSERFELFVFPCMSYPLIQISGRSRATLRASPACSAAPTTAATSL